MVRRPPSVFAECVETWRDHHPDAQLPGFDPLSSRTEALDLRLRLRLDLAHQRGEITALIERAPNIIDRAARLDPSPPRPPLEDRADWQRVVGTADRALALEFPARGIERGLGIEL